MKAYFELQDDLSVNSDTIMVEAQSEVKSTEGISAFYLCIV